MSKPRSEDLTTLEALALRNIAIDLGMEAEDATELFVANNDRESTARAVEAWTRGNRP